MKDKNVNNYREL